MTVKRFAAFIVAVGLIIGALILRSALDDNSSSTTDGTDAPSGGRASVICSTEFRAVCAKLSGNVTVNVEPAGTTLVALSKANATPPDAWITLDPFPAMLDLLRTGNNLDPFAPTMYVAATDTPVLAVLTERKAAVTVGCGTQPAWKCIGAAAGKAWTTLDSTTASGNVLPGIDDPYTDATGLVTFANAVSGYFNSTTFDRSSWENNQDFTAWMRNVSAKVKVATADASPLGVMLVRKSEVSIAATSTAEIDQQTDLSKKKIATISLTPSMPIVAVVATFNSRARSIPTKLVPLLQTAGWVVAAADAQPELPAGTFIALRQLWKDYNK